MDPCEKLALDLDLEITQRSELRWDTVIRFFLRLIGFEWLYNYFKGRSLNWEDFLRALVALDIAAAIVFLARNLQALGLKDAAKELLKKIGPWAIAIWVAVLAVEIYALISTLSEISDEFDERVRELYDTTDCATKDDVFRQKGVPIPQ